MKTVLPFVTILLLACFHGVGAELQPGLLGEYYFAGHHLDDYFEIDSSQKPSLKRIDKTIDFKKAIQWTGLPFTNHFGVRWTGKIRIPTAGTYTFFLESDDGSQLYIYDRKVVANDGLHSVKEVSGDVDLPAGDHAIRIDYFQFISFGACKLSIASKTMEKQVVPATMLLHEPPVIPPAPAPGPGLVAEYFDIGRPLWRLPIYLEYEPPSFTQIDPSIAHGDIASFGNLKENFYVRWTGKLAVPANGLYTFSLGSDDGSRLYVDGKSVIDHDGTHRPSEKSADVTLTGGPHDIKVEYFQAGGTGSCLLWWEKPTGNKEIIPTTAFSH